MNADQVTETSVEQRKLRLLAEIQAARDRSANGTHTADGRFAAGNPGGPGNPHAGQVAKLRAVLLDAVTEEDMLAVVLKLLELAKGGDVAAVKLLLDRTVGKPLEVPVIVVQSQTVQTVQTEVSPEELEQMRAEVRARIGLRR